MSVLLKASQFSMSFYIVFGIPNSNLVILGIFEIWFLVPAEVYRVSAERILFAEGFRGLQPLNHEKGTAWWEFKEVLPRDKG